MAVSSTSKTKQAAKPQALKAVKSSKQKMAPKKPVAKPATKPRAKTMAKPQAKPMAKPVAKALASKPKSKAVSKTGPVKTGSVKTGAVKTSPAKPRAVKASAAKSAPRKLTLDAKLTQVEARLKRANALTRKNVKTLETLVEGLQAQSKKDHSQQTAKFAAHVKTVNNKLTGFMSDSQTEISKDLFEAAKSTNLSDIEAALARSDTRLAETEMAQSDAMMKMNRHLANLATVMEARLGQVDASQHKLQASLNDKTAALGTQIKTVETDTSNALNLLGDKIENFAQVLDARQNDIDTIIGTKIKDVTAQTQAEFDTLQNNVQTRLDTIEQQSSTAQDDNKNAQAEQQMKSLKDRLHMLEQYIADMDMSRRQNALQMPLQSLQHAPQMAQSQMQPEMQPSEMQPQTLQAPSVQDQAPHMPPAQSNVVPINDAFAPSAAADNPYAPEIKPDATSDSKKEPAKESHIPIEFNPEAYAKAHAPAPSSQGPQVNQPVPGLAAPLGTPLAAPQNPMQGAPLATELPPAPHLSIPDLPIPDLPIPDLPIPDLPVPDMPLTDLAAKGVSMDDLAAPSLPPMGASGEHAAARLPQSLENVADNTAFDLGPQAGPIDAALPYADPAYAEGNEMRAERIGAPSEGAKLKFSKPDLSKTPLKGRYLKLLLIGSAIAIMGLFAGKMVLGNGGKYAPVPQAQSAQETAAGKLQTAANGASKLNDASPATLDSVLGTATTAPIGQYTETSQTVLSASGRTTLEDAANSGNPIAKYQLGLSHMQQNKTQSGVKLLRAAAAQNMPAAQYALAKIYETGQGVTPDLGQALQLTERAAQSGHRIAMHDLALYYTDELNGVAIDVAKAESWFEKAAQHGVVDSQYNLAVLAELKEGASKDLDTAYFWYTIAAKQGDQFAQQRIDVVASGLTPERIAAADARIAAFKPRQINAKVNGIFKDVPWAQPVQNVKIEQIRQAQTYLADLGYDVGTPDGAMGPRTRAAITEFEKAQALPETGAVNEGLLDKLELAIGA